VATTTVGLTDLKCRLVREDFADAVAWVARNLPSRPTVPVLAGVLLTGTVVFRIMDFGQEPTANEMAGTLAAARTAATLDVVQLGQGAVSGQVSLVRNGTELGVSFDLAASAPVDVVIAGEGRKVQVSGLGPHGKYGPGPTTIPLPGFEGRGQALQLTFLIGGHEVARSVLREPAAP